MTRTQYHLPSFQQTGWAWIAFFPAVQAIERTPLTIATLLYLGWALWSLGRMATALPWKSHWLGFYLLLMLALSGNLWVAHYPQQAFTKWLQYLAYSSAFPIIWLVLHQTPVERLTRWLAWSGLLTGLILLLKLGYFYGFSPEFQPRYQLEERLLPMLLPFLLYWAWYQQSRFPAWILSALLYGAGFAYIVISQGRTALLAYIIASCVFAALVVGWNGRKIILWVLLLLSMGALLSGHFFFRDLQVENSWSDNLDRFTSNRSIIWRQALQHPPDNPWLGWGMGHIRYHAEVLQVQVNGITDQYKHLHNFILDVSYETGWLGLGSLLLFIGMILQRGWRGWQQASPVKQRELGLYLTSSSAILIGALLDTGYDNKLFNLYLFLMLAVILHLAQAPDRAQAAVNPVPG